MQAGKRALEGKVEGAYEGVGAERTGGGGKEEREPLALQNEDVAAGRAAPANARAAGEMRSTRPLARRSHFTRTMCDDTLRSDHSMTVQKLIPSSA